MFPASADGLSNPRKSGKAKETAVCIGSDARSFAKEIGDAPCQECGAQTAASSVYCGHCKASRPIYDPTATMAMVSTISGFYKPT